MSLNNINLNDFKSSLFFGKLGGDIDGEALDDLSGYSVSLSGDGTTMAVGAPLNDGVDGLKSISGHVRVYKFFDGSWVQLGGDIDGDAAYDQSGVSVSLSDNGTIMAIGAPYNTGVNGSYSGHVRVYEMDASNANGWVQVGGDIDGEDAYDQSGFSVSLSDNGKIVAIGAPRNGSKNSGHVRVYERDASKDTARTDATQSDFGPVGWNRVGTDVVSEDSVYGYGSGSGYSVSLSDNGKIVAIGAPYNTGVNGVYAGHVRVYERDASNEWVQLGGDIDGEAEYDWSGYSVSLSDNGKIVAIGARYNGGVNGPYSGHVRVYEMDASNEWVQLGGDIDGEAAGDESGFSVSLSADGTTVAIGAILNDVNGASSGHVRVYQLYTDFKLFISLVTDVDELTTTNSSLTADLDELTTTNSSLTAANSSLKTDVGVLTDINTDLQSDFLKLSNDISELKSSNSSLKSELTKTIYSMKK